MLGFGGFHSTKRDSIHKPQPSCYLSGPLKCKNRHLLNDAILQHATPCNNPVQSVCNIH